MKNPIQEIEDKGEQQAFSNLIKTVLGLAVISAGAVICLYIYKFSQFGLSPHTSIWGQFGDYMGGTLNPIFGFLTVVSLLITLIIQNDQLKLSKTGLDLTRIELKKSVDAQNKSQKALNKQAQIASKAAKLNTISFLLNKYANDIEVVKKMNDYGGKSEYLERLNQKRLDLENMVESIFDELISIE